MCSLETAGGFVSRPSANGPWIVISGFLDDYSERGVKITKGERTFVTVVASSFQLVMARFLSETQTRYFHKFPTQQNVFLFECFISEGYNECRLVGPIFGWIRGNAW